MRTAKQKLSNQIAMLEAMQLPLEHSVHVLVGTYDGAFKEEYVGDMEVMSWPHTGFHKIIKVPGLLGDWSIFWPALAGNPYEEHKVATVVLPVLGKGHHSLEFDFVLAHELAHLTEPGRRTYGVFSRIWREARADTIAFLLTGVAKIKIPSDAGKSKPAPENAAERALRVIRDLAEPAISGLADAVPNSQAFHANSQILSGFLYALSTEIGRQETLELIRWMDATEAGIPDVRGGHCQENHNYGATIFVDDSKPEEVRQALKQSLGAISARIRAGLKAGIFTESTVSWINAELTKRGL